MRIAKTWLIFLSALAVTVSWPTVSVQAFDCVETTCGQMRSCAEAHYKLTVCHHTKRDADSDGIPCEDLCGKDMATYLARVKAQAPADAPAVAKGKSGPGLGFVAPAEAAPQTPAPSEPKFACAGKRKCAEMNSCDEAKFYLNSCGTKSLDGDHDGVPCNSLCR